VPRPPGDLSHGRIKPLGRGPRIEDASLLKIDADAADAGPRHGVQLRRACRLADHGDAASPLRAELAHPVQRGRIVRAVDAGRHDHDAVHVQRVLKGEQRRGGGGRRRVAAPGPVWKPRRVEDMHVAIAGAARHLKGHWRLDVRRVCVLRAGGSWRRGGTEPGGDAERSGEPQPLPA
jgi:hypothetical protein